MVSDEYKEYLRSDKWQRLRSERLKIDHYKCQRCGRPFDLQVHHLFYPTKLGTEDPYRDLITLCDSCHEIIEQQKHEFKAHKTWISKRDIDLKVIRDAIRRRACYDLSAIGMGTRDYCNLDVIKTDFGPEFEGMNLDMGYASRVQAYFRNRRYQVILTMMEGGATRQEIIKRTKFSGAMVNKVLTKPESAREILRREKELFK